MHKTIIKADCFERHQCLVLVQLAYKVVSSKQKTIRLARQGKLKLDIVFILNNSMARLKVVSILDLPDEILEHIMTFLSLTNLFKLSVHGIRFKDCVKRVSRDKPFRKCGIPRTIR